MWGVWTLLLYAALFVYLLHCHQHSMERIAPSQGETQASLNILWIDFGLLFHLDPFHFPDVHTGILAQFVVYLLGGSWGN